MALTGTVPGVPNETAVRLREERRFQYHKEAAFCAPWVGTDAYGWMARVRRGVTRAMARERDDGEAKSDVQRFQSDEG
jgi:hypothetical protein